MNNNVLYRTKYKRFDHPAGTVVVKYEGYDYGLSRDDTDATGYSHVAVREVDDTGYFTIQVDHLELFTEGMPPIDPNLEAPLPELINGKKIRKYLEAMHVCDDLSFATLIGEGDVVFTTSRLISYNKETGDIETQNTSYRKIP